MRENIKNMFKKIDWSIVFLIIVFGIGLGVCFAISDNLTRALRQTETIEQKHIRICRTYSNDFWQNDIDFIDGKCYYKGKEVEIK